MKDILEAGLRELNVSYLPVDHVVDLLYSYSNELLSKNEVMNLTAITEPSEVARLHMLDCAAAASLLPLEGKQLIDVGTGAGFPGMVLKLLCPSLELTMLDSLKKRLDWLDTLIAQYALTDTHTIHARAEEAAQNSQHRERYDIATARAVASLPILCELCVPFLRTGGVFLAMKSVGCDEEIHAAKAALPLLGATVRDVVDYRIPTCDIVHRAILIEKINPTPAKYPRSFAKIKKMPLGV